MDIKDIIKYQKNFDEKHGWSLNNNSTTEKLNLINNDIIGIIGEIGEFSNLIKKLNLLSERGWEEELDNEFKAIQEELEEELIDSFIYLIRIASHLDMDISEKYLIKLDKNKKRFKKYENN